MSGGRSAALTFASPGSSPLPQADNSRQPTSIVVSRLTVGPPGLNDWASPGRRPNDRQSGPSDPLGNCY